MVYTDEIENTTEILLASATIRLHAWVRVMIGTGEGAFNLHACDTATGIGHAEWKIIFTLGVRAAIVIFPCAIS